MTSINLVVALQAEAQPLIGRFGLKRRHGSSQIGMLYESGMIRLSVSGIGRVASAATVGYVHGCTRNEETSAWLNIGVAGHGSRDVGEGFIAHSISESATGRVWHPPLIFDRMWSSSRLITVDAVETAYGQDAGYDMEASGFYAAASRASTSEIVQSYKVVSDTKDSAASKVADVMIGELIDGQLDAIEELAEAMLALAVELDCRAPQVDLERWFHDRWRFSATQRAILRDRLTKLTTLDHSLLSDLERFEQFGSAKSVLKAMNDAHRSIWHKK